MAFPTASSRPRRRVRRQRTRRRIQLVSRQRSPHRQGDLRLHHHGARGYTAAANGLLEHQRTRRGNTTFVWKSRNPTASYLTTASIGRFDLRSSTLPNGLLNIEAIDVDLVGDPGLAVLDNTADYLDYLGTVYGPYPFEAIGAIVDDADEVGYALETRTPPHLRRRAPREHRGPRARAPVGGQPRQSRPVAGHLAQRGHRHLLDLAMGRARRQRERGRGLQRPVFRAGRQRCAVEPATRRPRPRQPVRDIGLHPRRHDRARAARGRGR